MANPTDASTLLLPPGTPRSPGGEHPISLVTPAGTLGFTVSLGGLNLPVPHRSALLPRGDLWWGWQSHGKYTAELLLARPDYQPEGGIPFLVDDCWVAFLAVAAQSALSGVGFRASWQDGFTWKSGGSSTGERLAAHTWEAPGALSVSLGTDDEEGLAARAGRTVPSSWGALAAETASGHHVTSIRREPHDLGWSIAAPALATGETGILHFAMAWKAGVTADDVATWIAVDLAPWSEIPALGKRVY